jgi:hypothetical protein
MPWVSNHHSRLMSEWWSRRRRYLARSRFWRSTSSAKKGCSSDGFADGHFPKREKAEHGEVEKMSSVADLVEVAHAQASLAVCDGSAMGWIREEGLVLLHSSAAEERCIIMRPYGFDASEINALGKAEVLILLDQASRGDIGNLLCCSCALREDSGLPRARQPAAIEISGMAPLNFGPLEAKYNLK